MKIIYDDAQKVFRITCDKPDAFLVIETNDIVEARERFIGCVTELFNEAVCKQLK